MVVYDEENFIYFQCRKDELIISSGYRISPVEIEKVIESDPRVLEAVVGGVEDDVGRTRIEAHVLPAGDATNANSLNDEIVELVRERLGAHKAPDRVILLKNLPQTRSGKVDRSVIFD
ncbi:MAG: AMP-dependent synthetase, partial [Halobacteriales archaeon]